MGRTKQTAMNVRTYGLALERAELKAARALPTGWTEGGLPGRTLVTSAACKFADALVSIMKDRSASTTDRQNAHRVAKQLVLLVPAVFNTYCMVEIRKAAWNLDRELSDRKYEDGGIL